MHLIKFFGQDKPAEEINVANLDNYVAERRKQVTNCTINKELGMMKRAWKWGTNCELLGQNRIEGYEKLPEAKPETSYLSMEDINTLLTNTEIDFRIFLLFILYTGVRIEKALMLRWREIDFQLGVIMILANVKTNKRAVVPLAADLAGILTQYRERINPDGSDRIFPWTYNAIRLRFNRLRKRTGLTGYTLNSLRHTFATYSSFLGGDHQATSKAMGHSSERTTGIYTHYPIQRLRDAVSKLDYLKKLHADIFADI
jgi:integrase